MNPFLRPLPLVLLALSITLFLASQPIVGALCVAIWIGVLAVGSIRQTAVARSTDVSEDLDPESRILFSPIRRCANDIEAMATKKSWGSLHFIADEASLEATQIKAEAAKALMSRRDLKRALRDQTVATNELQKLEVQIQNAASPEEANSLSLALEARKLELSHYERASQGIERIDAYIKEAESALAELKARLTAGQSLDTIGEPEELRESLKRLKSLGNSLDEAEAFIHGT